MKTFFAFFCLLINRTQAFTKAFIFITVMNSPSYAAVFPFSCTYSRDQVIPPYNQPTYTNFPIGDGGNGTIKGNYNNITNVLTYTISFERIQPTTEAGFYEYASPMGTLIHNFSGFPTAVTSGSYSNTFTLTPEQETTLLANLWYSSIKTTGYLDGEISTQIVFGPPDEPCAGNRNPEFLNCPNSTMFLTTRINEAIKIELQGSDEDASQTMGLEVVDRPFGPSNVTGLTNNFSKTFTWIPDNTILYPGGFGSGIFRLYDNCGGENFCKVVVEVIISCSDPIIIDKKTVLNLNGSIPVITGNTELLDFFTFDKSSESPNQWKAILNRSRSVYIKNGGSLTTSTVDGYAPGIEITTSCIDVDKGGEIVVSSSNKDAGNILIKAGEILVRGKILNEVKKGIGIPGSIKLQSSQIIDVFKTGVIEISGVKGGNEITLVACQPEINTKINSYFLGKIGLGIPGGALPGYLKISGLIKSFSEHSTQQNRPLISLICEGPIEIVPPTNEPMYTLARPGGKKYDIYPGLLSWVGNGVPGKIEIQAGLWFTVRGHGDRQTGVSNQSFGTIAAINTASGPAPGGIIDVRVLGQLGASNRAFDVSGSNNSSGYNSMIRLWASIVSLSTFPNSNGFFNSVVDASSPSSGFRGGVIDIKGCSGIYISSGAKITSAVPPGPGSVQGINRFAGIVSNLGLVTPAYITDNVCRFDYLYPTCLFGVLAKPSLAQLEKFSAINAFPNPFKQYTTIGYTVKSAGNVKMKIVNSFGNVVATLINSSHKKGSYTVKWNAMGQASGVYYVHVKNGNDLSVNRIVLLR